MELNLLRPYELLALSSAIPLYAEPIYITLLYPDDIMINKGKNYKLPHFFSLLIILLYTKLLQILVLLPRLQCSKV